MGIKFSQLYDTGSHDYLGGRTSFVRNDSQNQHINRYHTDIDSGDIFHTGILAAKRRYLYDFNLHFTPDGTFSTGHTVPGDNNHAGRYRVWDDIDYLRFLMRGLGVPIDVLERGQKVRRG